MRGMANSVAEHNKGFKAGIQINNLEKILNYSKVSFALDKYIYIYKHTHLYICIYTVSLLTALRFPC